MTLPMFEELAVDRCAVKITGAGDGLSEALRIEHPMHLGENAYFVVRGVVTGVTHTETRDEILVRVHTIKTAHIAQVNGDDVDDLLAEAADRLERARAAAKGQTAIDEDGE